MTTTQQPEAIKIADEFKLCAEYDSPPSMLDIVKAETCIRRLHARVVELENITEAAKRGFSAITKRHDDWKWRALEAESQLEAIGAGGVESLRASKPLTDEQIKDVWYECGIGITYDIAPSQDDYDWAKAIEKRHGIGA